MDSSLKAYFSVREVCIRYGVGTSTVYDWINHGQFPKPKKFGPKLVRFHIEDLLQWEKMQEGEKYAAFEERALKEAYTALPNNIS